MKFFEKYWGACHKHLPNLGFFPALHIELGFAPIFSRNLTFSKNNHVRKEGYSTFVSSCGVVFHADRIILDRNLQTNQVASVWVDQVGVWKTLYVIRQAIASREEPRWAESREESSKNRPESVWVFFGIVILDSDWLPIRIWFWVKIGFFLKVLGKVIVRLNVLR